MSRDIPQLLFSIACAVIVFGWLVFVTLFE
jgi:hypothetical protein